MPIHDWTRVRSNRFHDFHQRWTIAICNVLNAGRLPSSYFAMVEQKTGGPNRTSSPLSCRRPSIRPREVWPSISTPPKTRFVNRTEAAGYARKANRLTIRHPDGDVVAIIEIVSPGNKDSRHAIRAFARKAVEFLEAGVHLLIVDLFPPGRRDPQGIHKVIWDRLHDEPFALPPTSRSRWQPTRSAPRRSLTSSRSRSATSCPTCRSFSRPVGMCRVRWKSRIRRPGSSFRPPSRDRWRQQHPREMPRRGRSSPRLIRWLTLRALLRRGRAP